MPYVCSGTRLFCFGIRLLLVLGTIFAILSKAQARGISCQQLFEPSVFSQKPDRLYDYYLQQIEHLSNEEIASLNQLMADSINNYIPPANDHRAQAIDWKRAQRILDVVFDHPTIGFKADDFYSQPGEEMGFCFGRAMYMHLLALKLGIQKESIKKIWAVGPMHSDKPGIEWGYHVALLIFSKQGWIVLDPNSMRVLPIQEWVRIYSLKSLDGRLRFYATGAEKFGLYSGQYSRYILGLDLTPSEDWFKHYFVDMLNAGRNESLADLGLSKMTAAEGSVSTTNPEVKSMSARILEFFGF